MKRAILAVVLLLPLAACGNGTAAPEASDTSSETVVATVGQPSTTTTTTTPATSATTTAPPAPPPTGPRIVYFRVAAPPSCPAGTNLNPIDGNPVTLEWQVANANSTELSVDGPGLYGAYGTTDSATIFFPCGGTPGTMQSHTYTLKTVGGGPAATQTLTVQARVNEIIQV